MIWAAIALIAISIAIIAILLKWSFEISLNVIGKNIKDDRERQN